jgi:hypothetical protein
MTRRSAGTATALFMLAFAVGTGTMASPAVAANIVTTQQYTIGNGSVLDGTAVAQPDTAGATANYTVGFTTPSALSAGSSTITLADATGGTTFPANTADYLVIDNTASSGDQPAQSANLGSGADSVTLGLSKAVGAGSSLSVYVIGATNPATPGYYSLYVSTSANPGTATTAAYQVVAATSPPSFDPVAAPPLEGGAATYTIGVFRASSVMTAGNSIMVSSSVGAGADDNLTFPSDASAYKISDLTTGASFAPQTVALGAAGGGLTGQAVLLSLPTAVAAGDELSLTIEGVRNPSSTQSDTVSAAAPSTSSPITATVQIGTSVTGTSISLSQSGAGSTGVEYIIGFRPASALPAGGTVSFFAPSGTAFDGSTVTLVDTTRSSGSANVPAASVRTSASSSSSTDNQLTFTVPNALNGGDSLFVEVGGARNPAAGTYGGAAGDFTVATSSDVVPAEGPSYSVTAAPAPVLASVEISPPTPGASAQYAVGNLEASTALVAGSSTVEVQGPSGTVFPGAPLDYTIVDISAQGASAHPASISGGGTNDVVLTMGSNIAAGHFLELTVSGALNPPTGNYQMSVTGDVTAAVAPPPQTSPAGATSVSMASSSQLGEIGQAVTYTATVSPVPNGGTVHFTQDGTAIPGCSAQPVNNGRATCTVTYWAGGAHRVRASYSGTSLYGASASATVDQSISLPSTGYWLATSNGQVFAAGAALGLGGMTVSSTTGPVVGVAATPTGKGYWLVTTNGTVAAFGDAKDYGDLPGEHVATKDITAIAPTYDGKGYWLVGRDGGMFTFGDARFHGSVPGLGKHVRDIVGMVASPDGTGYLVVGTDGGVFTFGSARFYGSVPGLGKHINDVRAILPAADGEGYILVGSDGGAFTFGQGTHFLGSLPGRGIRVNDIVGLALTPDNQGYFMAGSNGSVYGFGDANPWPVPAGLISARPVAAVVGT